MCFSIPENAIARLTLALVVKCIPLYYVAHKAHLRIIWLVFKCQVAHRYHLTFNRFYLPIHKCHSRSSLTTLIFIHTLHFFFFWHAGSQYPYPPQPTTHTCNSKSLYAVTFTCKDEKYHTTQSQIGGDGTTQAPIDGHQTNKTPIGGDRSPPIGGGRAAQASIGPGQSFFSNRYPSSPSAAPAWKYRTGQHD